jgi:rhodanese-related sulfurtransferase
MENVQNNVQDAVQSVKNSITSPLPTPPDFAPQSSASDLKERLNWGEPALTIIDVRDRNAFEQERIMGAVHMPMSQLVTQVQANLEPTRDIYIYSDSDGNTAQAAQALREAGFQRVAELSGGLSAWKSVGGSIEGIAV